MYSVANARSRSAPARGDRARPWPPFLEEPVEIKVYDVDDVQRLAKWQAHETEVRSPCSKTSESSILGFERPLSSLMSTVFIIRPIPDNLVDIYSFIAIYVVSYIFGLYVCRAVYMFVYISICRISNSTSRISMKLNLALW